jgi:hypothetical protein
MALPMITPLNVGGDTQNNDYPLYTPDNRVIIWELKRSLIGVDSSYHYHKKNRWVVPYNKTMAAVMGTNTATYMLGSTAQAKGPLHYIMDYLVKDPTAMVNVLSLVNEARRVTNKYKSTAEDCEATERKATRFLTRIVNNISTKSEVPVTMAAAALLDMTSTMCSHHFQYVHIESAVAFIVGYSRSLNNSPNPLRNTTPQLMMNANDNSEDDSNQSADDDSIIGGCHIPSNNAAGELYRVDDGYVSIPHHIHYAYRGYALQTFCLKEYVYKSCPSKQRKLKQQSRQK